MSPIALPLAELKPALTGLGKIISRHSSLPILHHVKIERTKDGWVALSATDLERYVTVRLEEPAEGEPAVLLVPFEELQKITRTCSREDSIILENGTDTSVTMRYPIGQQNASMPIDSLPAEDFPEIPKIRTEPVPVPDALRTSLHEAMECSSTDETRYVLNGAYIDVSDPNCHHVVATDGRILYGSNSFRLSLENSLIIPRHPFLAWKEFNSDGEWLLRVAAATENNQPPNFQITSRRWRFISRQIEGNYPNWRQVLPDPGSFRSSFGIPPESLDNVLLAVQRMPCDDSRFQRIGIELKSGKLHLLAESSGAEQWTRVEMPVTDAKGSDVTIFMDRRYLATALKFGLNLVDIIDAMSPLRVSSGGRQMIIMPIRADASPQPEHHAQPGEEINGATEHDPDGEGFVGNRENIEPSANGSAQGAAQQPEERSSMMNNPTHATTNSNGANSGAPHADIAAEPVPVTDIDSVIEAIEDLKESLTTNLADLKSVTSRLKQIKREQKANEREIHSVRQTLRSLQGVKL